MSAATAERLAVIAPLKSGAHEPPRDPTHIEACIMEAVAWLANEPWSDAPECACPVLCAFMQSWNDGLPDAERDTLLRPLIPRLIGTRATPEIEQRRAVMAADWLIRSHTPVWLRLAGLSRQADALASLPEITDFLQCSSLMPALEAAQEDAGAARDAAWAAARDAARGAAGAAAGAAVWDAAWDAAGLRQGLRSGMRPGMRQLRPGMRQGLRQGMRPGMRQGLQPGVRPGMRQGLRSGLRPGMRQLRQGLRLGMRQGLRPGMRQGMRLMQPV